MRTRREAIQALPRRAGAALVGLTERSGGLRRVASVTAVLVAAWSISVATLYNTGSAAPAYAVVAGVLGLAAWLAPPRRPLLLPGLVVVLTLGSASDQLLSPATAAAMALAVVHDADRQPWRPWAAAGVGITVMVLLNDQPSGVPVGAVAIGGLMGLLVRSLTKADRLAGETRQLRGQAAWLEQRTAVARELHDVVGHHVTAMVVQAEAGMVAEPQQALGRIADLGRTALGELDALVVHLRDPDAELVVQAPPRLADVDELLAAPLRAQGTVVEVRLQPDLDLVLDELQVLAVYRIVQESLTNVARHARARTASVEVLRVGDHLRLRVSDDGLGAPADPDRGSGLLGIDERVRALGGFWELGQRLGGGTVVDVVVPLGAARTDRR